MRERGGAVRRVYDDLIYQEARAHECQDVVGVDRDFVIGGRGSLLRGGVPDTIAYIDAGAYGHADCVSYPTTNSHAHFSPKPAPYCHAFGDRVPHSFAHGNTCAYRHANLHTRPAPNCYAVGVSIPDSRAVGVSYAATYVDTCAGLGVPDAVAYCDTCAYGHSDSYQPELISPVSERVRELDSCERDGFTK